MKTNIYNIIAFVMFSGHVNPGVDIFSTFTDLVIMRNKYEFLKMHFFVKFYGRLIVDHDV
ncbi:hypothetical protein T08_15362 [Trichinella sp. T8]|nr:hypothetical protein T08_15362 [Trichinella sp. T8]